MYKKNHVLRTSADFDNVILFQIPIEAWQDGELIDYGGVIESHTEDAVKIQGSY